MTPQTLIIDREIKGVGRMRKATGTTNPAIRKNLNKMLTKLASEGRLQILRDIKAGRVSLMVVYDAWKRDALDELPSGKTAEPLAKAFQAWLDTLVVGDDCSKQHKTLLGTLLKYFIKANPDAMVADLPDLLEAMHGAAFFRKHPRSFNLAKAAASVFIRRTLKKKHPLWAAVRAVESRRVPKAQPRPDLTPDFMRAMFPRPESDHLDACAWAMALTGMGPKEYWGRWEILRDRVRIHGTKREARLREVPRLPFVIIPPLITREAFRQRLEHRTSKRVSPYDFRRTFARWMESAGITRARRIAYLGHQAGDITGLYERSEITAYLEADAKALREWLGIGPSAPQPLTIAK